MLPSPFHFIHILLISLYFCSHYACFCIMIILSIIDHLRYKACSLVIEFPCSAKIISGRVVGSWEQCLRGDYMKYVCLAVLLQHHKGRADNQTSSNTTPQLQRGATFVCLCTPFCFHNCIYGRRVMDSEQTWRSQKHFSHYSLLVFLWNDFDCWIEALWPSCIEIWGTHFMSKSSIFSVMAGYI